MREIKSHLKALIDSVEKMDENSEGQLLGGFVLVSGEVETQSTGWNANCNCNCECGGNGNCNCNCNCWTDVNCTSCDPSSKGQRGAGFTGFPF